MTRHITKAAGHLLAASLLFSLLAFGCGGEVRGEGELVVVSDGIEVVLYSVSSTGLFELASASIPSAGLLSNHTIFDIVKHPSESVLYVSSANDIDFGTPGAWGNGRIDRFRVNGGTLTYAGVAYLYDNSDPVPMGAPVPQAACEQNVSGIGGQVGDCAPVAMTFNSTGTRLYVREDREDVVGIFSVDPSSGALTFIAEGGSPELLGLALAADNVTLYNGSNVLDVTGDSASDTTVGDGGNGTIILPGGQLATTIGNDTIEVFDLTNPAMPTSVDELLLGSPNARDIAYTATQSGFAAVGRNTITTIGFTGTTLIEIDDLDMTPPAPPAGIGGGLSSANREYWSVGIAGEGAFVVAGFFTLNEAEDALAGGVTMARVDGSGMLTEVVTIDFSGSGARAVLSLSPDSGGSGGGVSSAGR